MEHVLLKFGLCVMVVVDEGKEFCSTFKEMCRLLNIRCHTVAKRNHKVVGVERFHRFLNHAQRYILQSFCFFSFILPNQDEITLF